MKLNSKVSKVLGVLLALVVAVSLWLYVITIVSPESEAEFNDITVVLQGEAMLGDKNRSGGLMLMMEEIPTVDLVLTGNRSDLNKLNRSNITVTADLTKIYEEGEHQVKIDVSYPGDIPAGAISVQRKDPGYITVSVERKITDKAVPVVIADGGSNVKDGYIIQDYSLDHELILITGPASVVDKIAMARIDVNYDGRSDSFREDFFITLCNEEGEPVDSQWIEVDHGSVLLSVEIHEVKQIALTVTVENGGGATIDTSEVLVMPDTINVHGTKADLVGFDSLNLGTIKLADYDQDTELEFQLDLPDNVEVMGDTQTVNVSVKFPELQITELVVKDFKAINTPEKTRVEILAKEMRIRVRGPKSVIEKLTNKNVRIELDLTGVKQGNSNITATVVLYDIETEGAGALGTYQVPVKVTQTR